MLNNQCAQIRSVINASGKLEFQATLQRNCSALAIECII